MQEGLAAASVFFVGAGSALAGVPEPVAFLLALVWACLMYEVVTR